MSDNSVNGMKKNLAFVTLLFALAATANATQAAQLCSTQCLRVYSIDLADKGTSISGIVKLWDETGSAGGTRSAVIHVVWTRPDGSVLDQYDIVGTRLRGEFSLYTGGVPGTYTLTVADATKSGYTFDPQKSNILNKDITVGSVGNQPPVAVSNADVLSGGAPLTVNFDSSGSIDPDGSIVGKLWNFGDGHTSNEENPAHTYQDVGSFEATLTVTDNVGATDSSSLNVTVTQGGEGCQSHCLLVDSVVMSYKKKSGVIKATVVIADENGNRVDKATVRAVWNLPDGSTVEASDETNKRSRATLLLQAVQSGDYILRVTEITRGGSTFDPEGSNVLSGMIYIAP